MDLIDLLYAWDLKVLRFVNGELARPVLDVVMKMWSAEAPWFVLTGFLLAQTAYRRHWLSFKTILWLGATVGLSDALAAQVLKPTIGRIRPCKVEDLVRVVEGCAGSLSFPSNHASNAAAFAIFWLLWKGPKAGVLALGCMIFVGFSRIYLGNHYPSDVLGGIIFGGSIGFLSYLLYVRVFRSARAASGESKKGQTAV